MPLASTAMELGILNWPGPEPVPPHDLANRPVLSNLATRALLYPSETKMLPAASQATSVGWLKLSPGVPAPGVPPPRPPPPPPPPRAAPAPGAPAGAPPGAAPAASARSTTRSGTRSTTRSRTSTGTRSGTAPFAAAAATTSTSTGAAADFPDRFRRPAQNHENAAVGGELDDRPGAAVHRPGIALGIDPDALGPSEAVGALFVGAAKLAYELPGTIELEQTRTAGRVEARCTNGEIEAAALVVDPQVAGGGGGDTGHFTQVDVGRHCEEITSGIERDFLLLGEPAGQPASRRR